MLMVKVYPVKITDLIHLTLQIRDAFAKFEGKIFMGIKFITIL